MDSHQELNAGSNTKGTEEHSGSQRPTTKVKEHVHLSKGKGRKSFAAKMRT